MRTFITRLLIVVAASSLAACASTGAATPPPETSAAPASEPPIEAGAGTESRARTVRLVTLGDSYTYGTGTDAPRRDSWPSQLAAALVQRSDKRVYLRNLAQGGSSSSQVLEDQVGQVAAHEPDVVTLQVGVNDIIGNETEWYRGNISAILDELLLVLPPQRIFVVTTPDHMLTEWGQAWGSPAAVDELNTALSEVAAEHGVQVIDIGSVNDLVSTDPSLLVQADPPVPFPTAKQYAGWVEAIGPHVYDALAATEP